MTEINFRVPRPALEAFRFASVDANRKQLHAIHFEAGDDRKNHETGRTAHAVTTDSFRMIHLSWKLDKDDKIDGTVNIDAKAVQKFLKAVGKQKKDESPYVFRLKSEGDRYILGVEAIHQAFDVGPVDYKYTYPMWRDVLPEKVEGTNEVSQRFNIDLSYVEEFGKYMKACGCDTKIATIHYADKRGLGPVLFVPRINHLDLFTHNNMKCEYVVMPTLDT